MKARRGEIPVWYKTVPAGDVVGGLIYVYRSFEFRCDLMLLVVTTDKRY